MCVGIFCYGAYELGTNAREFEMNLAEKRVLERSWPLYCCDEEFPQGGSGIIEVARQYAAFFEKKEGAFLLDNVSSYSAEYFYP